MRKIKKKSILDVHTHLKPNRYFPIQAISKAKRQDFSEQNLQKQQQENITLFKQR